MAQNDSRTRRTGAVLGPILILVVSTVALMQAGHRQRTTADRGVGLEFIDTSIENGSPLWYDVVDDVVRIHLLYDHERGSPNRAAGHINFRVHARPGARLT